MKKATSVQEIKNVKDIIFSIDNYPMETESKLTIVASTDDDIFEFVFEGSDLLQSCKKAGLFTGWEKDQKIRELEKELANWKKEAAEYLKGIDVVRREKNKEINKLNMQLQDAMRDERRFEYKLEEKDKIIDKLKHENDKFKDKLENVEPFRVLEQTIREKSELRNKLNLEKAANEAQHKFFREYAGKGVEIEFGYPIDTVEEVSYVIVDKEEYQSLKDSNKSCIPSKMIDRVHELEETNKKLKYKIAELEELQTPTIENFADEKPSNRRDILKAAEKCVCGQREQDYGTPESNFQLIADLWNDYLKKERSSIVVDAKDVAMMMALMKIARIRNGGGSGDSFVDLAGYAACGGEIWHGQKAKDQN